MVYLKLFWAFLKIGLFSIGGAYSFLPVIEREVVEKYSWMDKGEFLDILGLVRIFPGAISIKYATYVGYKVGKFWGAIIANLGNILPPAITILLAVYFYGRYKDIPWVKSGFKMVQLAVCAMIIAVVFKTIDWHNLLGIKGFFVAVLSLSLFLFTKLHPAFIILLAYLIGAFSS